tara:strand:- start:110 stop:673 length:564 start_codon:yes stop_codon:yes gene_type:complete
MEIGLDFDGVIANNSKLKNYVAKDIYDIDIPSRLLKRKHILNSDILSFNQYRNLQFNVYYNKKYMNNMEPVDGSIDYMCKFIDEGHNLKVVTSRTGLGKTIAKEWMEERGLDLPVDGVGYRKSKAEYCSDLDFYIDDDLEKLVPLIDVVPNLSILNWDYNKDIFVDPSIIKRMNSWKEFYTEVKSNS